MTTTRPQVTGPTASWGPGSPAPGLLPGRPVHSSGRPVGSPGGLPGRRRLPLRRTPWRRAAGPGLPAGSGRLLAGVCAGTAAHLGVPVSVVRLLVLAAVFTGGAGLLLYALLWVLVPSGNPWAEAAGQVPVSQARLASRLTDRLSTQARLSPRGRALVGGAALLGAAVVLALWRAGALTGISDTLPLALLAGGVVLAWSQMGGMVGAQRDLGTILRLSGGVALAAVGVLVWLSRDLPPASLVSGALVGGALVLSTGLILAPVLLRTNRELVDTRAEQARAVERADIAAHLHDSVLQTLTLIRKRAHEPDTVARLARSQERELRAWLYTDRPAAGTSVSDAFKDLAAEVEDLYGTGIDVVTVGDLPPDQSTEVVLAATREALSNAVRHGAPPVSLYVETSPERIEVFVRDHGEGFDPTGVSPDRHGVRESIIGRMERHGGRAQVRRLAQGTEIHLLLPTSVKESQ